MERSLSPSGRIAECGVVYRRDATAGKLDISRIDVSCHDYSEFWIDGAETCAKLHCEHFTAADSKLAGLGVSRHRYMHGYLVHSPPTFGDPRSCLLYPMATGLSNPGLCLLRHRSLLGRAGLYAKQHIHCCSGARSRSCRIPCIATHMHRFSRGSQLFRSGSLHSDAANLCYARFRLQHSFVRE